MSFRITTDSFIDWKTGQRWENSEYSLLDTAIFLNGCMVVAEAFPETASLAGALLDRVEWTRFLMAHPINKRTMLSFGWNPDGGGKLLYPADVRSSELAMPYFLAAGSRTHPIPAAIWYNTEVVWGTVAGLQLLNPAHALFTSYYGLGWMSLQGWIDQQGIDLDANVRQATLANRAYCRTVAADMFQTCSEEAGGWWGLSAGDSPAGYVARGPVEGDPNGTVWPMAALAAIAWLPEVLADDLTSWRKSAAWARASGKYGLSPFSTAKAWVGEDLIGIDVGSYAVNWANYQQDAGAVSPYWMRHPIAQNALQRLSYTKQPQ